MNSTNVSERLLPLSPVKTPWSVPLAAGESKNRASPTPIGSNIFEREWYDTGQVAAWFMNPADTFPAQSTAITVLASTWQICGVANYSGGGFVELMLNNQTTGALRLPGLDATVAVVPDRVLAGLQPSWPANSVAIDDNGDGWPELIWQKPATGQSVLRLMNGLPQNGAVDLGSRDSIWTIRN